MNSLAWGVVLAVVWSAAWGAISAAPWVPTKRRQRERLFANFPLKLGATIVDLGCGNGALLFAAADANPGLRAIGYEVSLLPLALGLVTRISRLRKYRNVSLRLGNLFNAPIGDADVVCIFLLRKCYPRLKAKLRAELRPDARIILEAWPFDDETPERVIREEGLLPVYVYRAGDLVSNHERTARVLNEPNG